jgi:putative DNA primase/helicase
MNALEFLNLLFENKPEGSQVQIVELPSRKATNFDSIEEAAKYVEGLHPDSNVYVACGILPPGFPKDKPRAQEAVIGIFGFWADIDFGDHGNGKPYPPDLKSVLAMLDEFPLKPSLIVFTGHGVHVYWLFKEVCSFDDPEEKALVEQLCRRLQATLRGIAAKKGCTIDSTHDLARILRVPGTYNNKPGRPRAKVEVLVENSFRYDPPDFDPFLVEDTGPTSRQQPSKEQVSGIAQGLKADPQANPPVDKFNQLLTTYEGFRLSWEGDRARAEKWSASDTAMSLANYAARAEWTDQEIADLIIAHYRKHQSTGVYPKPPSMKKATRIPYLARTIAKARASAELTRRVLEYVRLNEVGDARLFAQEFRDKFAYDHDEKRWYLFHGHCWMPDFVDESLEALDRIAALYKAESARHMEETAEALSKRAFALGGHDRRRRVLKLAAAGQAGLGVTSDVWDQHPYWLACQNGVVDLRTGALQPGSPELFIRNFCPTVYNPAAGPPTKFLRALNDYFDGDQLMIAYLQRLFGLSLIGEVVEPVFPIFLGRSGQNAKTTLVETVGAILGPELAGPVSPELLLEQDHRRGRNAPTPDIMALRGKRFVWASEVNGGRSFDASQVKLLTGNDTLVGRDPFGRRIVSFKPSHLIVLVTNTLPAAPNDSSYLIREQVTNFRYSYVDDPDPDDPLQRRADRHAREGFSSESTQILKWMVEGCIEYLQHGLNPPEAVRADRPVQITSVDEFARECIQTCIGGRVGKTQAYKAYVDYSAELRRKPVSQMMFARAMKSRFEEDRVPGFRFWKDIRLIPRVANQSGSADQAKSARQQTAAV